MMVVVKFEITCNVLDMVVFRMFGAFFFFFKWGVGGVMREPNMW